VIVLCAHWRESSRIPLARWVRAGIDQFVTIGQPGDIAEVLRVVEVHAAAPPPAEELRIVQTAKSPSLARDAVLHALRNASATLHAPELARRFGYSPRTFRDFLLDAGFPRPRDVCRSGVFLKLVELEALGIEAPQDAARRLGFSDASEMRKAKSRFRRSVDRSREEPLAAFVALFPRFHAVLRPDADK